MRNTLCVFCVFVFLFVHTQKTFTSVLVTDDALINGKKNLSDTVFRAAANDESGLGTAINFLLTGNPSLGYSAKSALLRSITTAVENLPLSRGYFTDISSQKLYDALLIYDIIKETGELTGSEVENLRNYMNRVLDHYLNRENFAWDSIYWCLGATAMRIVASCTLYALNFPDNAQSERYLIHSRRFLEKNLTESIDDSGAWITNSPGFTDEALEYIIVTSKVLKNANVYDYFSDSRLRKLLRYEMHLLPPQQCPLVKGSFMIAGDGETDPGENHGDAAVIAAADILPYDPETSSNLLWYWNQCGNPVNPLGILFIDTSIQPSAPDGGSMLAGDGMVVLRDQFGTQRESFIFAHFGAADGVPDREMYNYSDRSDFSFIWRGIPLIVPDVNVQDNCMKSFAHQAAWRHNIVLRTGAGDSPILQERASIGAQVQKDVTGNENAPADFYPDGINQFMSTEMVDYVSGAVRLPKSDVPAASHYRHILFLKPDALLIWDQVESNFPLEWNLWVPVENTWTEQNIVHLHTKYNVDLKVHFDDVSPIDYIAEKLPSEMFWDWPTAMRADYGNGIITLMFLDLFGSALNDTTTFSEDVLYNILMEKGQPSLVGLMTKNIRIVEAMKRNGIPFTELSYEMIRNGDLSAYSVLLISDPASAEQERALYDFGWKITDYISQGGSLVLLSPSPLTQMFDTSTIPGFIPVTTVIGNCAMTQNNGFTVSMRDDQIWKEPRIITSDALDQWISESTSQQSGLSENDIVSSLPIAWSDSWKILASSPRTLPLYPDADNRFGELSRIQVRHPASKDFFCLFLPRRIGETNLYLFDVRRTEPGFFSFADPTTTWEIKAGKTDWTDANLSVRISNAEDKTMYAFDCTYIKIESETLQATSPMSVYYSEKESDCIVMTAGNNTLSFSKADLKIKAGELRIHNLFGNISLERLTYVSILKVVDQQGNPVGQTNIYIDSRLIGVTGKDGTIPIRWASVPPMVRVHFRDAESLVRLEPGEVRVVLDLQ